MQIYRLSDLTVYHRWVFFKLLSDDQSLYDWIEMLEEFGVCIIKDAPPTNGQVSKLAERVAFVRKTNYGYAF